jgi:hypothetical protein
MRKSMIDLTGQVFGDLTVVKTAGYDNQGKIMWSCVCSCGNTCVVRRGALRVGHTTSCGCKVKKRLTTHGKTGHPLYRIWCHIKGRCDNPTDAAYMNYGGRGITYEDRWKTFEGFWEDMHGTWQKGLEIDRIDNNGNYCKENCRWATRKQQANNKRNNHVITYNGISAGLVEWSELRGIAYNTLYARLYVSKQPIEKALGFI